MMTYLLQTVQSPGETGTVSNVQQQSLVHAIEANTAQLEALIGQPLPQVP